MEYFYFSPTENEFDDGCILKVAFKKYHKKIGRKIDRLKKEDHIYI